MPLGSSSDAPVINPGPSVWQILLILPIPSGVVPSELGGVAVSRRLTVATGWEVSVFITTTTQSKRPLSNVGSYCPWRNRENAVIGRLIFPSCSQADQRRSPLCLREEMRRAIVVP
jgi:hypothetical protein